MGIFVPSKSGDAMGVYAYQRMGKKQRKEFAIQKQTEEERKIAGDFYASKRISKAFNDTVKSQRKDAGLE